MNRRQFVFSGVGLGLGVPALFADGSREFDRAAAILADAVSNEQLSSACLLFQRGKKRQSVANGAARTPNAVYLLASISKPISAAAFMTLYDQKEFRLDDPVTKFLPEFRSNGREGVTIHQLLTHTSGLPDQLPENAALRARQAPLSEFVEHAIRTPLRFVPGTRFGYSSMGILLASEIAQRISQKPFVAFVEETVYRPLGMSSSAMGIGKLDRKLTQRCQVERAAPESGAGDPKAREWDWNSRYWRHLGAPWGGGHGSAIDVAAFLASFLHPEGQVVRPETARMMIQNQNPQGFRSRGLGFDVGLHVGPKQHADTFGHTGSTGTLCWADPASDTICVVLTTLPARAVTPHPRDLASGVLAEGV